MTSSRAEDVFIPEDFDEEQKMISETCKIMGEPELRISATTVRVPVYYGHSEVVNLEFERPLSPEQARAALANAPGVVLIDDPEHGRFPVALDCAGRDETFVGRVRRDGSVEHGLNLWVVADNLLKGAAANAVQIARLWSQARH